MVRALEHSSYKIIICEVGAVLPNHTSCSPWSENFKMKIVKYWESVSFSKKKDKSFFRVRGDSDNDRLQGYLNEKV